MDCNQIDAFNTIVSGHNLVLIGQAGTGKTFTIKQCVKHLRSIGKTATICCYTGIACLQYQDLEAMTLHHFAGLQDGRHSNNSLVKLVLSDERYIETKKRISYTDTLIIDEVSMVSKKTLTSVEYLCRQVREDNTSFGGIQVVLAGDFYQLSPVADELYGDSGQYCFESEFFNKVFPHKIILNKVHRQTENKLIQCINELEKGSPSAETNLYLNSLSRPLPEEFQSQSIKLFAQNLDADIYNNEQLQLIDGALSIHDAHDYGDIHYLKKMVVPKKLALKKSVKVMLLKNIDKQLVNGLVGTVKELNEDYIEVNFDIQGKCKVAKVARCNFTRFDPVLNVCIARRFQFPLKLAYAITIHKSQGMSIPFLEINCRLAAYPGQIGVAVGRAMSSDGLRVINYSPYLIKKHSQKVNIFYEQADGLGNVYDDLRCCQWSNYEEHLHTIQIHDYYSDSDLEDFERAINDLNTSDHSASVILDHTYCDPSDSVYTLSGDHTYSCSSDFCEVKGVFETALHDFLETPMEENAKLAFEQIMNDKDQVIDWYHTQFINISDIFEQCCTSMPGSLKQKQFTEFYTSFHRYLTSAEYINESQKLLKSSFAEQILSSVMFGIQSKILSLKSESIQTEHSPCPVLPSAKSQISPACKGKIRYVGGYCVAKCRYRLCSSMKACLFIPGMEQEMKKLKDQIKLLDRMSVSASEISSSSIYNETLEETTRKQNVCESLTNISDSVYDFFTTVEITSRELLTYDILVRESKYMYRYIIDRLLSDNFLFECFVKNCCSYKGAEDTSQDEQTALIDVCDLLTLTCSSILVLYDKIVKLFVAVAFSQFRKDYLRVVKREKGKALRKRVLDKKAKDCNETVTLAAIKTDKSSGKVISHLKLKANAMEDSNFYTSYKKTELIQLLKAYGQPAPTKLTKMKLGEKLYNYLLNEESLTMSNTETVTPESEYSKSEPQPGTSVTPEHVLLKTATESSIPLQQSPLPPKMTSAPLSKSTDMKGKRKRAVSKAPRKNVHEKNTFKKPRKVRKQVVSSEDELDDDRDLCGICSKPEDSTSNEFWISCDSCLVWYLRDCIGLTDDDDWNYFSGKGAVFICPMCN